LTPQVGIISHDISTVGYLLHTLDGGRTWGRSANTWRALNVPATAQRFNRIAFPQTTDDLTTRVNNVAVGGLSATTDGIITLGIAGRSSGATCQRLPVVPRGGRWSTAASPRP